MPLRLAADDSRRRWLTLFVTLTGSFMALIDVTVVNVALPSIERELQSGPNEQKWVVSAYAVAFGLALIPCGRLGDAHGRKRLFMIGLALFTLASVACAAAQSPWQLIAARVVQGAGAGAFLPQISATIQGLFSGHDRARAFGYLGSVVAISTAVGPVIGGVLVQFTDWRWVFLINLPLGLLALIAAGKLLIETQDRSASKSLDPVGLALLATAIVLIEIPLTEGQALGWPLRLILCLAASAPCLAVFLWWEKRQEAMGRLPLVPPSLLKRSSFAGGGGLALVYFAGFSSLFFTFSIFWQQGLDRSALSTGSAIVPFALGGLISASRSAWASARLGRRVVVVGATVVFVSLSSLAAVVVLVGPSVQWWAVAPSLFFAGLGNGLVIAPNQNFSLVDVPRSLAGVAGGVLQTAQRMGTAIGISIIGTVLFGTLGNGDGNAFVSSFALAMGTNAALVFVALVIAFRRPQVRQT